MPGESRKVLQFAGFALDADAARVSGPAGPLPLRPKAFDVLTYLARHPGRVVTKDELIAAVWPNIFVTDNSLTQCISDIRAALDDDGQHILKTVARRGYLFAAAVTEAEPPAPQAEAGAGTTAHALPDPVPPPAPAGRRQAPMWLAGLALVLAAGGFAWWSWHGRPQAPSAASSSVGGPVEPPPASNRFSVAVLPFAALGAPATDEYFADGLTEDIIAALGRFAELSVLSPAAVFAYKGKTLRPDEIGRDLKATYIAEGSVRRSPERIRVAVRLTDAARGTLLWADQYDAEPDRIFAIQDDITRRIAGALAVQVTNVEQSRVAAKPPGSLDAYDLVLSGRDFLSRLTRSATSNAREMFERAVELDPNYAAAHVGLGRVDLIAVHLGWTPDPAGVLRRAESHARKAAAIDEFNPAAHVLLGRIHARLGEYDRAIDALRHALALNPSDPETHAGLGDALLWAGDLDGAIRALETAVALDPKISTENLFILGAAYFLTGQEANAIATFERPIMRSDSTVFIHAMLAAIHAEAGRKAEAERAAADVRRLNPFFDLGRFGSLFRNRQHREKIVSALQKAGF